MKAPERYNTQLDSTLAQMQQPIETRNGLYVWEVWTYTNEGTIINIRFYAEDVNGGNTRRISAENYYYLIP